MFGKYTLNNLERDEFARPSGVLAMKKEAGITSHDLVDQVRRKIDFRKVGHAGTLDTFATGLMLILVGKATKLTEGLIIKNKQYRARVLLGISTDTQDIEGVVLKQNVEKKVNKQEVEKVLEDFIGDTEQYVSAYSSVKVDGDKLRVLMRNNNYKPEVKYNEEGDKIIDMIPLDPERNKAFKVEIPKRVISISELKLEDFGEVKAQDYQVNTDSEEPFQYIDIVISCSKGTYIRQLAEDIGTRLGLPAMLIKLERTMIADISLGQALTVDQLA